MNQLMEPNQFTQLDEQCGAILVSGKLFNNDDELIWPTEGRFSALSGLRYAFLVVSQTKAKIMPRQQTLKTGQMIQYDRNML